MLLLRAREASMAHFRPLLARNGLTEQQWRVLRALADRNGMEAAELARRTIMLRPSVTGVVDRLARDGLVERRRDRGDGRKVCVWMTRKAKRLYERIAPQVEREYARIQAQFTRDEWEGMYAALEHLERLNGN
jgi:homoprotocatechuate degradation regulator HpaR